MGGQLVLRLPSGVVWNLVYKKKIRCCFELMVWCNDPCLAG
jgi:hypothetical protein